jgi:hypothetical protein
MVNPESQRVLQALGLEFSTIECLPNVFVGYAEHFRNMVKGWNIVVLRAFATAESPYAPMRVRRKTFMARGLTIKSYCEEHGCDYDSTPRLRVLGVRNIITGESLVFDLDGAGPAQIEDLIASIVEDKIVIANDATHTLAWISHAAGVNYSGRPFFTVDPLVYLRMFFSLKTATMPVITEKTLFEKIGAEIEGEPYHAVPWMPEFLDASLFKHAQSMLAATDKLMRWIAGDTFSHSNMEALKNLDYARDADAYIRGLVGTHLRGLSLDVPRLKKILTDSLDDCEGALAKILETLPELAEFRPMMSNPDFSPNGVFRERFIEAIQERFHATIEGLGAADLKCADVPIAGPWATFIKAGKRYSYFARIFDSAHEGRIYPLPSINAVTGRASARYPEIYSLPKAAPEESVIVPRTGSVFLKFDYSQIEIRIAAAIAAREMIKAGVTIPENGIVAALKAHADIHHVTALACRGASEPLCAYHAGERAVDDDRRKAKAINFGLLFGMGDTSFRRYSLTNFDVDVSVKEAGLFRIAWYGAYPELQFWHRIIREAKRNNRWIVRTLSGRPLVAKTITGAYNYACQGSCVDICARAFRYFEATPSNISKYVVGFKFDEFTFEVPAFAAPKIRPIVEACMTKAADDFLQEYEIPAGEIGFSLQKEAEND